MEKNKSFPPTRQTDPRLVPRLLLLILAVPLLTSSSCANDRLVQSASAPNADEAVVTTAPAATSALTAMLTPTATPTQTPTPTPAPTATSTPTPAPQITENEYQNIVWYDGYADPNTFSAVLIDNPDDITVLVNKYFTLPRDYTPTLVPAASSDNQTLRPEANAAWDTMRDACYRETGQTLYLCSGSRTWEEQAGVFERSVRRYGIAHACSKNALQGRSEHELGLAIDISTDDIREISSDFLQTTAGAWVALHCSEYGFILRYPDGASTWTGYAYEPWHYRYLGQDLAQKITASGDTMEEYYGYAEVTPPAS